MRWRLIIGSLFTVFMILSFNIHPVDASNEITVYVHGEKQRYDQPPVMDRGRLLVPLRGIFESLGASVNWNASSQTVDVYKGNTSVWLKIGSKNAKVNGKTVTISVPPQMRNGRTLVPIRFVSEALGEQVHWDEATRTVYIGRIVEIPAGKKLIRGMRVGMTKQQVKQTERAYLGWEEANSLYYPNVTQYGFTGTLIYEFENDRLKNIAILYPEAYLTLSEAETLYWLLMYGIEQDFGRPDHVDANWFDDRYNYTLWALWEGNPDIFLQVEISETTYDTSAGILIIIK